MAVEEYQNYHYNVAVEEYQKYHSNVAVEGVSKLLFQCGSRDAINRVSTTMFDKSLIFNVLYVVTLVETWRAASLQHQCRNFDTPTTTGLINYLILSIL